MRVVPEPTNPVNQRAVAIRSIDGLLLAGYVPDDELDDFLATIPLPIVGIIVWEAFTWRPRVRKSLIALVGPSISLRMIPASGVPAEQAGEA